MSARQRVVCGVLASLVSACAVPPPASAGRCEGGGANLARNRPVQLDPMPNYRSATKGDARDLTDGITGVVSKLRPGTVEWRKYPAGRVTVDLAPAKRCSGDRARCPSISQIRVHVHQHGRRGIPCPTRALFEVSDDGERWRRVARWDARQQPVCGRPTRSDQHYWIESPCFAARGARARVTLLTEGVHLSIDEVQVRSGAAQVQATPALPDPFDAALAALGSDWLVRPARALERLGAHQLPPGPGGPASLSLVLAGDEAGAAVLAIVNPGADARSFEARLELAPGPAPAPHVVLRRGVDIAGPRFQPVADALPRLAGPLRVAARSVGYLWLDVAVPRGTPAGTRRGELILRTACTGCTKIRRVPVELRVRPFALPAHASLDEAFFDWGMTIPESLHRGTGSLPDGRAALRRAYGATAHRLFVPRGRKRDDGGVALPSREALHTAFSDITRHDFADRHLLYLGLHGRFTRSFFGTACFDADRRKRARWEAELRRWVRRVVDTVRAPPYSLGYDQFALYPVDEPGTSRKLDDRPEGCGQTTSMRMFEAAAQVVKELDPKLQVFVNPAQHRRCDRGDCPLDRLAKRGLVDIWMPNRKFYDGDDEVAAFYRERQAAGQRGATREQVWIKGDGRLTHLDGHPHRLGRLAVWRMAADGLGGIGYWNLFELAKRKDGRGKVSAWRPLDGETQSFLLGYPIRPWDRAAPAGLPEVEAVVPSRRLYGLRQGIEDFRYLVLLDRRIAAAGSGRAVAAARTARAQALSEVTSHPDDLTAPERARETLAGAIESLR